MKVNPIELKTKTGLIATFKSADGSEARAEIDYLKKVSGETKFLLSEPEDVNFTVESEREFLENYENSPDSLMLNVYVDGVFAGNGSFAPVGSSKRQAHRCSMGIAIFREFCNQGIGELLIKILMEQAKLSGYEIMELDVVSSNERAIHLYKKLGFEQCGIRARSLKYKDGTYADEIMMTRCL